MDYMVSIDWYQYYCIAPFDFSLVEGTFLTGLQKNRQGYFCQYEVAIGEEYHPIYKESCTIKHHGFAIAHLFWHPRSSSLNPQLASAKVSNRALYSQDWIFQFHDILDIIHWKVKNITRIDICCDFRDFANGEYAPDFIYHYVTEGDSSVSSYIRKGKNKYVTYGTKKLRFKEVDGKKEIDGTSNLFDYLRFGSRNSGVCAYLYNKSEELRTKKSKPYIQEAWKECGLDNDPTVEEGQEPRDIYRLEFSIQAKGMIVQYQDKTLDTKPLYALAHAGKYCERMDLSYFKCQKDLEAVFMMFANKYWCFYDTKGHKDRRSMEQIVLLNFAKPLQAKPYSISRSWDSGRTERQIAKKMEELADKYQDMAWRDKQKLIDSAKLMRSMAILKEDDVSSIYNYLNIIVNPMDEQWHQLVHQKLIPAQYSEKFRKFLDDEFLHYMWCKTHDSGFIRLMEEEEYIQQSADDYFDMIDNAFINPTIPDNYV